MEKKNTKVKEKRKRKKKITEKEMEIIQDKRNKEKK